MVQRCGRGLLCLSGDEEAVRIPPPVRRAVPVVRIPMFCVPGMVIYLSITPYLGAIVCQNALWNTTSV